MYITLSNASRFYSSTGDILGHLRGVNGLKFHSVSDENRQFFLQDVAMKPTSSKGSGQNYYSQTGQATK